MVLVQDSSTMKCQTQIGTDIQVVLKIQRKNSIHLHMPVRSKISSLVLIQLHQKVESNTRKNGKKWHQLYLNLFLRIKLSIHMKWLNQSQMKHISKEPGNITENSPLRVDLDKFWMKVRLHKKKLIVLWNLLKWTIFQVWTFISMLNWDNFNIWKVIQDLKLQRR